MVLAVDGYRSANFGPVIELGDLTGFHVDTAVGHGVTKIVVPVSAMKAEAHLSRVFIVVEKHNIRDIRKIIISS